MEQGYQGFSDPNGDELKIRVEEATTGDSCSFDSDSGTVTFYLPKRPDSLNQLAFGG